jgi:hypothetical protein
VFLGRVVEDGEPLWLPEDRDIVDMFLSEERGRNACGHFPWEEVPEDLEPGYRVCEKCAVMGPYAEKIHKQNRERNEDQHGLTFAWFPVREEDDGH